jgi:hypothetical protein
MRASKTADNRGRRRRHTNVVAPAELGKVAPGVCELPHPPALMTHDMVQSAGGGQSTAR